MASGALNPSWETMKCGVCGSTERQTVFPARLPANKSVIELFWAHYHGEREKFHPEVVRCAQCGHIFAGSFPTDAVLNECYEQSKFDNQWGVESEALRRTAAGYLDAALVHTMARGMFVDIGCDRGLLLEAARRRGFEKVLGFEPNEGVVREVKPVLAAQNIDIVPGMFSAAGIREERVSMAALIHVLDHLKDPAAVLESLTASLETGGLVFAVVHDFHSWLAKLTGERFPPINMQHPHFFHRRSLANLFERAGLRVEGISRTYNFYPLSHYVTYAPLLPAVVRRVLLAMLRALRVENVCVKLPLGNVMIVGSKVQA